MLGLPLRSSNPDLADKKYIAAMFASGEQGAWYDPSDLSTLYQDAAGTIPVTAVGQPVGKILDKSGRGNHATQSTTASRPTLSAKVNLFPSTTTLNDWYREGVTYQSNQSGFNNSATAIRIIEDTSTGRHQAFRFNIGTYNCGTSGFIYRIRVKSLGTPWFLFDGGFTNVDGGTSYYDVGFFVNLTTGEIGGKYGSSVLTATVNNLGNGWWEIVAKANISGKYSVLCGIILANANNSFNYTGDTSRGLLVDGVDMRVANESANLPAYQRVNTDTDYDTAGFPYYLLFDGIDDSLVTGNINFTATDKMTVLTADHSAWDNATRAITGLSSSAFGYDGTFWLTSYDGAYSARSIAYLRGNLRGAGRYGPDQRTLGVRRLVRSFRFDISKDVVANETLIRLNGVPTPLTGTPQDPSAGSGNFGNWPLYIGRIGSQYPFSGHLYGLIVRGAATDDLHLTHAEKFLAYKSGVTL